MKKILAISLAASLLITAVVSAGETILANPKPLESHSDICGLDYVATPEKRTRAQALAHIKELSRWYPALYFIYINEEKYCDELITSAANNPEMAEFLYGHLTSDGSVTGGFTDEEQPENCPLFLQFDPRWGYMPYGSISNLGASGCGPTCISMVIFYLTGDRECTPDKIAEISLNKGYYIDGVGTSWSLMTEVPKSYGLSSYQVGWSKASLKKQLDKGNFLICSVRPGDFTAGGHFIVIYGYDENGFKINDPKCVYRSTLTWTYEQIQDDIKGCWTIGK